LLTSKDRREDIVAGLEAGADDYLIKPFDPHELQARLRVGQRILDLQAALLSSLEKLAQAHQREAETGARIQQLLLLGQPPASFAGVRVAALTVPSQHIDGDFYDFFRHNARCLDIIVGDVMGKGVPAALLGAAIKSFLLRALSRLFAASVQGALPEPEDIVRLVHHKVTKQFINLNVFATLCYARFELDREQVTLVDCGHTKTVHFQQRTGKCQTLQGDNLPLGFSEQEVYQQVTFPIEKGDVLVFYSDGLTEARNAAGEFFGVERLMEVIETQNQLAPEQLINEIHRAVIVFAGEAETKADDLTCVVVSLKESEDESPLTRAQYTTTSHMSELTSIREFVCAFCRRAPAPLLAEARLGELELAVTEAASNVMRHAYHGRADQTIRLVADAFADRVVIQLFHHGTAFDPNLVRPPAFDGSREGGFGVYIIAHSVDEVRYTRDEWGENCIYLVKKRDRHKRGESEWS
jgi:sigma-B regulation protein RsbU (phosphoserine phosphatase)